ncbi:MAG: ABC transporter substrate-binding protein [Alphaproteobacteria bacterium]|nr:ABC transporter substrate-binding protein [Alphaproteobacteria bacterium]
MKKVCAFIFSICFSFQAYAGVEEARVRAFLNDTGQTLISALGMQDLDKRYELLDEIFEQNVDAAYMGQYVLGQYRSALNDAQKKRYHALFKRYIKSLYKSYPIDFKTDEIGFEILNIKAFENHADAVASIDLPEKYRTENFEKIKVEFRVHEHDGVYQLADLKIGEASLLIALKSRFLQMFKDDEGEAEWFLEDLEDLVKSNEAQLIH